MTSLLKVEMMKTSTLLFDFLLNRQVESIRYLSRSRLNVFHKNSVSSLVRASQSVCQPESRICCVIQTRHYARQPKWQKKFMKFDYSGDLRTQLPLKPDTLHSDYYNLPEIENVSENVKKLCTVDFASGQDQKQHRKEEMRKRIHQLFSPPIHREMSIAMLTIEIRNLIPHLVATIGDKRNKSVLVEKIALRKKLLRRLRQEDYQRFLWLLKELQIRYVMTPFDNRRKTIRELKIEKVQNASDALRQQKIAELKSQLESEKEEFYRFKEERLKSIQKDAEYYGIDLGMFDEDLKRKRLVKTYPYIYTWEERLELEPGHPLRLELKPGHPLRKEPEE